MRLRRRRLILADSSRMAISDEGWPFGPDSLHGLRSIARAPPRKRFSSYLRSLTLTQRKFVDTTSTTCVAEASKEDDMTKKTLRRQIASMYRCWSDERDDYKAENSDLRHQLDKMTRLCDAWRQEALMLKRESQSKS